MEKKYIYLLYLLQYLVVVLELVGIIIAASSGNASAALWASCALIWTIFAINNDLKAQRLEEKNQELEDQYDMAEFHITRLERALSDYMGKEGEYTKMKELTQEQKTDIEALQSQIKAANAVIEKLQKEKAVQKTPRKKQKTDYTDQEKARIKNEMKAGGLIKEED